MIYKIILNYWNASLKFIWKEVIWMIVIKCLLTSYLIFKREDISFSWHRWDVTCSPGTFRMSWLPWNVDYYYVMIISMFMNLYAQLCVQFLCMHNCLYVQIFFLWRNSHNTGFIRLSKESMILKRFRTTSPLINHYSSLKAASL